MTAHALAPPFSETQWRRIHTLLEELRTSILLSNWGGVTGLSGRVQERCFLRLEAPVQRVCGFDLLRNRLEGGEGALHPLA